MGHWNAWSEPCISTTCPIDPADLTDQSWIQYRLDLATSDPTTTPSVHAVTFSEGYTETGTYTASTTALSGARQTLSFTTEATIPQGTDIAYERSFDGGSTWAPMTVPYTTAIATSSFTWRATLSTDHATSTPVIHSATFTATSAEGGGGALLNPSKTTASSDRTVDREEDEAKETGTTTATTTKAVTPTTASTTSKPTTLIDLLITLGIIPADKADLARTLATQKSSENVGSSTPLSGTLRFTRTLSLGDTGDDVKILQQFLNTHGFTLAPTGTGSAGNETTYFGTKTKSAVMKFQDAYKADILIPAGLTTPTGMFGTYSIQKAHAMLEG